MNLNATVTAIILDHPTFAKVNFLHMALKIRLVFELIMHIY